MLQKIYIFNVGWTKLYIQKLDIPIYYCTLLYYLGSIVVYKVIIGSHGSPFFRKVVGYLQLLNWVHLIWYIASWNTHTLTAMVNNSSMSVIVWMYESIMSVIIWICWTFQQDIPLQTSLWIDIGNNLQMSVSDSPKRDASHVSGAAGTRVWH